jgi:hypothetical protein
MDINEHAPNERISTQSFAVQTQLWASMSDGIHMIARVAMALIGC